MSRYVIQKVYFKKTFLSTPTQTMLDEVHMHCSILATALCIEAGIEPLSVHFYQTAWTPKVKWQFELILKTKKDLKKFEAANRKKQRYLKKLTKEHNRQEKIYKKLADKLNKKNGTKPNE